MAAIRNGTLGYGGDSKRNSKETEAIRNGTVENGDVKTLEYSKSSIMVHAESVESLGIMFH